MGDGWDAAGVKVDVVPVSESVGSTAGPSSFVDRSGGAVHSEAEA